MSKKSRRRNRRLLMLAALAGGAALAGRKNQMSGKETVSDAQKTASQLGATPKNWITKKSDSVIVPPKKVVTESVPIGRMRGVGSDADAIAGQNIRAAHAKNARINAVNTAIGSPLIDNPNRNLIPRVHVRGVNRAKGGSAYKKGGRVTGIAKRGFGRALMKGKK